MTRALLDRLDTEIPFHILRLKQAHASLLVLPDSYQAIAKLLVQVETDGHYESCHESISDVSDTLMTLNSLIEAAEDLAEKVEEWIANSLPSIDVTISEPSAVNIKKRLLDA